MSNIDNSNRNTDSKTMTTETNSEDFVSQLRQTINDTDYLLNNIARKWEQENPELAKQWQEILQNNQINDTTQ
jgi:hypothetical protein